MREKYFLFKIKANVKDLKGTLRVGYLEKAEFQCNHYFSECQLVNAGNSISIDIKALEEIGYNNVISILNKEDFEFIDKKNNELLDLGFGLDNPENEEKYNRGLKILKELQERIYKKLESAENKKLFDIVREQEIEYCTNYWQQIKWKLGITKEDIRIFFNVYRNMGYIYQDREIINTIFDDYEAIGEEWVDNGCIEVSERARDYFDFEAFGRDIVRNNQEYFEYENIIVDFCI